MDLKKLSYKHSLLAVKIHVQDSNVLGCASGMRTRYHHNYSIPMVNTFCERLKTYLNGAISIDGRRVSCAMKITAD